jgi:ATP-dependent DNA helicase RecG
VIPGGLTLRPSASVRDLKGVHDGYQKKLARVGVSTVEDLLTYYPRRYEDFTRTVEVCFLQEGARQTVRATVELVRMRSTRTRKTMVEAFFSDGTGRMKAIWFNQGYISQQINKGDEVVMSGMVKRDGRGAGLVMMSPAFEKGTASGLHTGRLVPLYAETAGLTSRWLRQRVQDALPAAAFLRDEIPEDVARRQGLLPFDESIRQIHFPDSPALLDQARKRIAFRQLLLMQVANVMRREERAHHSATPVPYDVEVARTIRDALPFALTDAQRRAAHRVFVDMAEDRPMARLLQGDVGSGKTVVAAMAAAMVARSGHQALLMAPTEILAQQHARSLAPYLDAVGVRMGMLAGSTGAAERRRVLAELASGEMSLLIGTHALLEPDVAPRSLALVITDEQHRFGVAQREAIAAKGFHPHVLSMTATPIPRTLQLTLYGDLTVSVLDELPPGRKPVETRLVLPAERDAAYRFVERKVKEGRQVFVICPLVEDSDRLMLRSATAEYERLSHEVFPNLRLGLLHGRMKAAEKDALMGAFKAGDIDILVTTSVVEVGVDVPNAVVMMIEGAERFGLAQLHQFRGRVGRGSDAAYCLLLSDAENQEANRRLHALVQHPSGFDLAEIDLQLRGPGDVLGGTAQSGHGTGILVAGLLDARLIEAAREEAEAIFAVGLERFPILVEAARAFRGSGNLS